jgi:hypothetical protein
MDTPNPRDGSLSWPDGIPLTHVMAHFPGLITSMNKKRCRIGLVFVHKPKWPSRYNWTIVESGVKHHQTNKQTSITKKSDIV